jgi:hypothetical protein
MVATNLFDSDARRISDPLARHPLCSDPTLGARRDRRNRGRGAARGGGALRRATLPMTRVGRARAAAETQGLVKVFVDAATGSCSRGDPRLLGCSAARCSATRWCRRDST